ncbi:hypothetical protein SFRURICE_015046 [Spodoptera frugiperda]|nr:hypothetical protein SFRURICE_015046 [Spodoptera frugiperda]
MNVFFWFFERCLTLGFSPVSLTRNNNLRITQRLALCGNRTCYTLHGSRLPSDRANCISIYKGRFYNHRDVELNTFWFNTFSDSLFQSSSNIMNYEILVY